MKLQEDCLRQIAERLEVYEQVRTNTRNRSRGAGAVERIGSLPFQDLRKSKVDSQVFLFDDSVV